MSQQPPLGPILPSRLHDADGDAVKQKAQEERKEELEAQAMGKKDPARQSLQQTTEAQHGESAGASQHVAENAPDFIGSPQPTMMMRLI